MSSEDASFVHLLHVAIAIAFITIAIPLKLDAHWITIGWLVESGVLLWLSVTAKADFLRYFAAVALALGIARLLFFDHIRADMLVFNMRFATYVVAIAILGGIAVLGKRHASEQEMIFLNAAAVGVNLLALIALTLEASDYFDRQMFAGRRLADTYCSDQPGPRFQLFRYLAGVWSDPDDHRVSEALGVWCAGNP